jgi:predicted  nucleic acid-binding Zn-ribbon protein
MTSSESDQHMTSSVPQLSIEQLQSKYEELNKKKIQAETRFRDASDQLQKLRNQALATWGTDDLDQLKLKLVQMQEENESRRTKYQAELLSIETKVQEIDKKYQAVRDSSRESSSQSE